MDDADELSGLLELPQDEDSETPGALSQGIGRSSQTPSSSLLQSGTARLNALTDRKQQLQQLQQGLMGAAEREAKAYEAPLDMGTANPELSALSSGLLSSPNAAQGLGKGFADMMAAKQKMAELTWGKQAAAEKVRANADRDILELQSRGFGRYGNMVPRIREFTNANGDRVQTTTDPMTGEVTQTVLGAARPTGTQQGAHLKAGFQWAKNPDGTPMLDANGMPMQAKIGVLGAGTVPGSTASGDIPDKGWALYKDKGGNFFRVNQNAGLVQKKADDGTWVVTSDIPGDITKLGSAGGASALNQRFANRVIGASNEGLAALSTIAGMGDPDTGLFGSKVPGNIFARIGAGALTSEQVKRYNATTAGLSVEIASAQNQGMAPNQDQIKHVEEAITIQPTDDATTRKYRVALAARYLDKALETSSDMASDAQKTHIGKIRENLKEFPDPNKLLNLQPEKNMFAPGQATGASAPGVLPPLAAPATSASQGIPAVGTIKRGYRFKGGNPKDQNSWEKVNG